MKTRYYDNYEEYVKFQSIKTLDPDKRKKWLGEEWRQKIDGFKQEFSKLSEFLTEDKRCLCLGARTGQEVVALNELGLKDVIGIDIVECKPNVIKGDMHNLDFESDSFDFVYTNVLDHSIMPEKLFSEVERVLKVGGIFYLQIQFGLDHDQYTEYVVEDPFQDVVALSKKSYCIQIRQFQRNFAGMNFEFIFQKDAQLTDLFEKYGCISTVEVPEVFRSLWEEINLPIQERKLDSAGINSDKKRNKILDALCKRAYYLTRIAEVHNSKKITEVGTAEGWQFYSFAEYCKQCEGRVYSCDPRDVRSKKFKKIYDKNTIFVNGTSAELATVVEDSDFFYIDGLHDEGSVVQDVKNLLGSQSENDDVVWIFDDFNKRFGCHREIAELAIVSKKFKIWNVGLTASGKPSHQVMIKCRFKFNED